MIDADSVINTPVSPCLECKFKDEDKRNERCETCEKRISYLKSTGAYISIDQVVTMTAKDLPRRKRNVRYCNTPGCNRIHYAGGYCRSCYYKKRYLDGKDPKRQPHKATVTLHFGRINGGKDILAALQEIAANEDRAVTKQAIRFICEGLLRWYDDHADRR